MNWKSILTVLATFALLCLLTGCGSRTQQTPAQGTPESTQETQEAAAQPDGEYMFTREQFPRLDGSASTLPFGQAVASVLLGESRAQVADIIHFNKTANAYRALMDGNADVLLASEPALLVWAEKDDGGYDWDMSPFAVDALVFIVNASNPVENLTREQLRDIYAGRITNWAQVGGEDVEIEAFQRDEGAGSQTAMFNLVMEGEPMMEAPTDLVRGEAGDFMEAAASFKNSPAAIGYSMYYYAHNMDASDGVKILSVDGVTPGAETIRDGSYPFLSNYYVVTDAGRPDGDPSKLLYDWILSEEGQRLAAHEGYIPWIETGGVS